MRIVAERVRAGRSYVTGPGGDVVALHGAARPSCTTTLAHIGRVPDSIRALGRVRTAADAAPADAQTHANLQKTLTMRTTLLFLLLIHEIVRKFPFFTKNVISSTRSRPAFQRELFEEGTSKIFQNW